MVDRAAYLQHETMVTMVISIVLSGVFHLIVFGWGGATPVWGLGAYAFDSVIQAFAIGLMGALVPGLLCRKAMIAGKISGDIKPAPKSGAIVGQALISAIASAVFGGGLFCLALWVLGVELIAFAPAFSAKVTFGAVLGIITTRRFLARML